MWKALTTYNRRSWIIIAVYSILLAAAWVAAFVSASFIKRQGGSMAKVTLWTSLVALTVLGLFGTMQGLASYWAYTLMKRALNAGSRRVTFKFMLAIAVTLFLTVARTFWNIANVFGVNVLDDQFTLLIVEGKSSAYAIYLAYFCLVEVVPCTAATLILAAEDVDASDDSYTMLSSSGTKATNSKSKKNKQSQTRQEKKQGATTTAAYGAMNGGQNIPGGGANASAAAWDAHHRYGYGTEGAAAAADFDHTLTEDDFVVESQSPYRNIDFHPGHVRYTSPSPSPHVSVPHYDASKAIAPKPNPAVNFGANDSQNATGGQRRSQSGKVLSTSPPSTAEYEQLAAIEVPHFGSFNTKSMAVKPTRASSPQRNSPTNSNTTASSQSSLSNNNQRQEPKFQDFHMLARPTSPSIVTTLSSSPVASAPLTIQSNSSGNSSTPLTVTSTLGTEAPAESLPRVSEISPSSSYSSPTDPNHVALSSFHSIGPH